MYIPTQYITIIGGLPWLLLLYNISDYVVVAADNTEDDDHCCRVVVDKSLPQTPTESVGQSGR